MHQGFAGTTPVTTNLNNAGVLTETPTARDGSAVTRAFAITPRKDETSRSASTGMVLPTVSHYSVAARL